VLRLAGHTGAHVPASPWRRGLPAHTAKAVALVPTDLRPALRHDPGCFRAELRRRATGLLKLPRLAKIEFVERILNIRYVEGKVGNAILKTEEHRWDAHIQGLKGRRAEPPELERRLSLDQNFELMERQKAAVWI
jgi:hypothetical protein